MPTEQTQTETASQAASQTVANEAVPQAGTETSAAPARAESRRQPKDGRDPLFHDFMAILAADGDSPGRDAEGQEPESATAAGAAAPAEKLSQAASAKDPAGDASPETAAGSTTQKIDEKLSARAKAAGLSETEIVAYGSDLANIVDLVEHEGRTQQPGSQAQTTAAETPQAAAPAPKPGESPAQTDHFASLKGLVDDAVIENLRKAVQASQTEAIKEIHAKLAEGEKAQVRASLLQKQEQYESAFSTVGDAFIPLIGKGSTDDMNPSSAAYRLRCAVAREAEITRAVAQQMGARVPTIQQAVSNVLAAKFPNRIAQHAREAVIKDAATRRAGFTNPPTNRRGSEPEANPDAQTLGTFREIWNRSNA